MADSMDSYLFKASDHHNAIVFEPIKNSQRIKYTCFSVSPSYISFGSSSGGVYLFQRLTDSCRFIFTIGNNSGSITSVAFAPNDEQFIAIGTSRGHLLIVQLYIESEEYDICTEWRLQYHCDSFTDYPINVLKWDETVDYRLYLADENGHIFVLHNVKSLNKLLTLPPPSVLLKLSPKVYQMDVSGELLLLSTSAKFCIYDLCDATLVQIGKKGRSEGQYGLCFWSKDIDNRHYLCIHASRPHSRLWECDIKGNVQLTHQFKKSIETQEPSLIVNYTNNMGFNLSEANTLISNLTFAKLLILHSARTFLVTYSNGQNLSGIFVIDPIGACIVAWFGISDINIVEMNCIGSDIFILYINSKSKMRFAMFSLLTFDQHLIELSHCSDSKDAAVFVSNHVLYFKNRIHYNGLIYKLIKELHTNLDHNDHNERQLFNEIGDLLINGENNIMIKTTEENREMSLNQQQNEDLNDSSFNDYLIASNEFKYNPVAHYFSAYTNGIFPDAEKISYGIDMIDIGINELMKLRDSVVSKLSNTGIRPVQLKRSSDSESDGESGGESSESNQMLDQSSDESEVKDDQIADTKSPKDTLKDIIDQLKVSRDYEGCKCDCGAPLPHSHFYLSNLQRELEKCIYLNLETDIPIAELIDISYDNGVWNAYSQLLLNCNEYDKYIRICLMLCDVKLLNCDKLYRYLNERCKINSIFEYYLKQIQSDINSLTCLECGKVVNDVKATITLEEIARLSIKCIGTNDTIDLLKHFSHLMPNCKLSAQFYLYLLRMQMISEYQNPMTRAKLEKLNRYVSSVLTNPFKEQNVSSSSSSNSKSHNSVKIDLTQTKCSFCHLSLNVSVNSSPTKIVVFFCKHYYHKSCLKKNHCYVCTAV